MVAACAATAASFQAVLATCQSFLVCGNFDDSKGYGIRRAAT